MVLSAASVVELFPETTSMIGMAGTNNSTFCLNGTITELSAELCKVPGGAIPGSLRGTQPRRRPGRPARAWLHERGHRNVVHSCHGPAR